MHLVFHGRFGEMKHSCQQDLDLLTVSMSHSDPVPRFHYETRTIPSIRSAIVTILKTPRLDNVCKMIVFDDMKMTFCYLLKPK